MNLKESAINYAKSGIKVFPLAPNSKKGQVLQSWKYEATTDIEKIRQWWDANPNYNIGIAPDEKLLIVDVDVKNNHFGFESLKKYGNYLPTTAKVETPSGGIHLYYNVKEKFSNRTDLYDGIDVKTAGGYVVAPPSVIDGKSYEWVNKEPIVEATEKIRKFFDSSTKNKNTPLNISNQIAEGQRNDTLFKLACSLQAKGLSDDAILSAMYTENIQKCNPPLSQEEINAIFESAMKYTKGNNSYTEPKKKLSLDMVSMDQVEEKEAQWLIRGFIPKGGITIIGGDGGVGKTTIWCDIVAAISSGDFTFFENENFSLIDKRDPQKVMYFSSEDDVNVTLKRRLRKSKAYMPNIITLSPGDERFKMIKFNNDYLKELIEYHRPRLIVFDPLQGFIPGNINMGYRNAMREVLEPLRALCEQYEMACLIMCHTNKRENSYGRNRLSDSSDIWDIARSVFIVGNTDQEGIRYLSHEKCNYGPLQETTLFELQDEVVTFRGTTTKRDREFMTQKSYSRKNKGAKDEAKELIKDQLSEHEGPMDNTDLRDYAIACGISKGTFERAKGDLKKEGIIHIEVQGFGKEKSTKISLISRDT